MRSVANNYYCLSAGGCTDGAVRLRNGNMSREGRVEICMGGVWGVIADVSWGTNAAKVTCRQLGFTNGCEYNNNVYKE